MKKPSQRPGLHAGAYALLALMATTGCSSGSDPTSTDGSPEAAPRTALDRRADALAVAISAPPSTDDYEIWSCVTETLAPIGYTFFRDGTFEGSAAPLRVGKELDPGLGAASEQLRYVWTTFSESTLRLEAPDRGIQIDWSDIEVFEDGTMTAFSSSRGPLWCVRNHMPKASTEAGR